MRLSKIARILIILLTLLLPAIAIGSTSPQVFFKLPELVADQEMPDNHTVIYRNKIFPDKFIKISTDKDNYRCIQKCPIIVTVENNWFNTKGKSPIEFNMETKRGFKFRETTGKTNFILENGNIQRYIIEAAIPFGTPLTKFNISINLNGKNILLDPTILSGCAANHANNVVQCNGTLTGNEISTNFSIYIHDATLSGGGKNGNSTTINAFSGKVIINSTHGWLNITNSTINGTGGHGGALGTKTTCGTGNVGGKGGNGSVTLLFNLSSIINKSRLLASSGNGGDGQRVNVGTDCGGDLNAGDAGRSGNSTFNITGYENNSMKIYNTLISSSAGVGGKGGQAGDATGCTGGGSSGDGGDGGEARFDINNVSVLYLFNVSVNNSRGIRGVQGANAAGCNVGTAGSDGNSRLTITVLNEITLFGFSNTADGRNNTNISSSPPSLGASPPVPFKNFFNLTSTSLNRFAMFNNSNIENNITLHCNAASLTFGNGSNTLDPQLNVSASCVLDNNVSFSDYFEEITVTLNSPDDHTFSQVIELNISAIPISSNGNVLDTVKLFINNTATTFKANQTITSVASGSTVLLNGSSLYNGLWLWRIEGCVGSTCGVSVTRNFTINTVSPTVTFINPLSVGNISIYNLTFSIMGNSSTMNWTNVTIYNNSILYKSFISFTNLTGNHLIQEVNFTQNGNYSVNVSVRSKTGLQTNSSSWFFYDRSAPALSITTPANGSTQTDTTINFKTNFVDLSNLSCQYRVVVASNFNQDVATTTYNCTEATFAVSDGSSILYTLLVNGTDGYNKNNTNITFLVDTSTPAPDQGGGGGGGGSSTTTIISADENIEFEVLSDTRSAFYSFVILDGDGRERGIIINNKKNAVDNIELSCIGNLQQSNNVDICDWLTLSQTTISIAESTEEEISFILEVPDNTFHREYNGQIKASYKDSDVFLDIRVKVSNLGIILKEIRIQLTKETNPIFIPVWVAAIFILIVSFGIITILSTILLKDNPNLAIILSGILSLAIATSVIFLI